MHPAHHSGREHPESLIFFKSFDLNRALNFAANEVDLSVGIKSLHRLAKTLNNIFREPDQEIGVTDLSRSVLHPGLASLGMNYKPVLSTSQ
jgi:hypothetical protein